MLSKNDMTWPSSVKNHGGDRFQGKSLDADQGLPRSDWAGVLPTQKFLNSNLVTPEKFLQFGPSIQKLFMIFLITDRWMDGQTHKLHAKQITPLPYTGMGGKLFIPHFFYLSQNGVSKWSKLTLFCLDKIKRIKILNVYSLYSATIHKLVKCLSMGPNCKILWQWAVVTTQ